MRWFDQYDSHQGHLFVLITIVLWLVILWAGCSILLGPAL